VKLGRPGRVEAKYTYTPMTPRMSRPAKQQAAKA
jgi:hypothetical protein